MEPAQLINYVNTCILSPSFRSSHHPCRLHQPYHLHRRFHQRCHFLPYHLHRRFHQRCHSLPCHLNRCFHQPHHPRHPLHCPHVPHHHWRSHLGQFPKTWKPSLFALLLWLLCSGMNYELWMKLGSLRLCKTERWGEEDPSVGVKFVPHCAVRANLSICSLATH